jgi:RNA polymerase sigma factor (sigma-70 family)
LCIAHSLRERRPSRSILKRPQPGGDFQWVVALGKGNGSTSVSSPRNAVELLAEFKLTGRQEAFEEIVRRYAAMVFGVCLKTTRNAHDAEDATQAVFLNLAVHCKSRAQDIIYVGPWLQKVARRVSLDIRRSRKRRQLREENHANNHHNGNGNGNGHHDGGQNGVDVEELKVVLNEELHQLPAKYRLPMILHYYGGLSREEMARELGCKPSTLGVRIHRGRQMLAQRLTERGASPGHLSLGMALTLAVRGSVSDGMIVETSRAAAELMAGNQLGPMISSHVLAFSHGAAGVALIAKLKAVAAVVLVALLTLGAAAGALAKVLPLDELRQWPVKLQGIFRLPRLQSPFQAPRADAGEDDDASRRRALAADVGAGRAPVRTVGWSQSDDRPRVRPGGTPGRSRRGPAAPARLVAQLVSSVISSHISAPAGYATRESAPAPAPRSAPQAPARPARAFAGVAAAARPSATSESGGGGKVRAEGAVAYGSNKPINPLVPPLRMFDGVSGGAYSTSGVVPVVAPGRSMTVGGPAGSIGRVEIAGGVHRVETQVVGESGRGTLDQTGGVNVARSVRTGVNAGAKGVYNLNGNRLLIDGAGDPLIALAASGGPQLTGIEVGHAGDGQFNIGDALGGGEVSEYGPYGPLGGSLAIRGDPAGTGTFRGSGLVAMHGFMDHNGRVIADGYGQDRTLEFNGFRYVGNSVDNPVHGGANGWFATDHGKLVLPNLRVRQGTHTYTWGEDPTDPTIDLINSARVTVHDAASDGLVRISLMSLDRLDLPALPQGHHFIGVWQFEDGGLQHGAVDLLVRYDDALAAQLKLDENVLKLWRYHDGQWLRIMDESFTRDTDLNLIGGRADALEFFAVSAPEPSTAALLLLGGTLLLRRRPRDV